MTATIGALHSCHSLQRRGFVIGQLVLRRLRLPGKRPKVVYRNLRPVTVSQVSTILSQLRQH